MKFGDAIAFRFSFMRRRPSRPDRVNLENVRRGQFEGMREQLKKNHDRQPDVGEPKMHPTAGVTVVGARKFLVAYNVNLNTSDISIANKIAKAIRFSSGGLRYVKSMGVDLKARNLAQVSINLTDYEQTLMHRVYEMVKREAQRYGAVPMGSEIVGLVPKKRWKWRRIIFCSWRISRPRRCLRTSWPQLCLERRQKKGRVAGWRRWRGRL
jgi:glutamate formiminotransferase